MQGFRDRAVAALGRVSLFSQLSPAGLASLAARTRLHRYESGEVIFLKDDAGLTFHVIVDGLVKICMTSPEGHEAVLVILKAPEFFGELSMLDGVSRSASAVAMDPTTTLVIDRDDFHAFVQEHPEAALAILSVIASRLRRTDGVIADAAFLDLPARVAKKLLELGSGFGRQEGEHIEIDIKLRQQDFAAMVGATRESVNRALGELEELGIVRVARQKITLLRPDLLQGRVP